MKLSELRPIIKALHYDDWFKLPGIPLYRKEYRNNSKRYMQTVSVEELYNASIPYKDVLYYYDKAAEQKLYYYVLG